MTQVNSKILAILVLTLLLLSACGGQDPGMGDKVEPSRVEPIEGSKFSRLILTEKAVQRLDIQTAQVELREMDSQHLAVPYAAIMYGLEGDAWVYTNPEPLVYIREAIVIDFIEGAWVALEQGPEVGTSVVTVGASLLYGAEVGVSK